ncbi:hypothetical protein DPMN_121871 [Dreissena polymorpha]|uniref:Uncharacterized protein n=1 Tax=Dreissena polymorpha TaxID=45954 RepID=A0A9D4GUD9_DREPO|nr:hypothetical protein DPMN_121871 [Dreissena polymorpha]
MALVNALLLNRLYNCVKFQADTINSFRDMLQTKFLTTYRQTDNGEVIPICRAYFVAGDTKVLLSLIEKGKARRELSGAWWRRKRTGQFTGELIEEGTPVEILEVFVVAETLVVGCNETGYQWWRKSFPYNVTFTYIEFHLRADHAGI